jgi:hypothetical protein
MFSPRSFAAALEQPNVIASLAQLYLGNLSDRRHREFWRREIRKHVKTRGADLDQLQLDG